MSNVQKPKHAQLRNVKVEVLRPHTNHHGDKFEKAKGEFYVHPRPEADIEAGLVKLAESNEEKPVRAAKPA